MSRAGAAAAAKSGSPEAASNSSVFLVSGKNSSDFLTALIRSEPFGEHSYPVDFGASVILASLFQLSNENEKRIERRKQRLTEEKQKRGKKLVDETNFISHAGGVLKISFVVWIRILDYLLCENTLPFIEPELIGQARKSKYLVTAGLAPHEYFDRVQPLEFALQNTVLQSSGNFPTCFFSINYQNDYEVACLLDAALNADLEIVEHILRDSKDPKMLRVEGRATITHLNIERTGTPLQMALYSHDEEMVAVIKRHMDPAEFQRQWEAVFGPDYNVFLERQQTDAARLCDEVEGVLKLPLLLSFYSLLHNNYKHDEPIRKGLNRFKDELEEYVRKNSVYNPYILQRLFEIYKSVYGQGQNRDFLMSQRVIGVAQKWSSPRWLQHWSQGIYRLAEPRYNEQAHRSFALRGSQLHIDIRSLDHLGVSSGMTIFGWWRTCGLVHRCWDDSLGGISVGLPESGGYDAFKTLMLSKNSKLSKLITPQAQSIMEKDLTKVSSSISSTECNWGLV